MGIRSIQRVTYSFAGFGDSLTHDLARGVPAALSFFPAMNWREVAAQIDRRTYPRQELCAVLERSAAQFDAPAAVFENIRKLREPKTYAVATGQQACLGGGPVFCVLKALTAIKLAQQYEKESRGEAKFVPIYWVAGDDHDLPEIDHTELLLADGTLQRAGIAFTTESRGRSACDAIIDPASLASFREELKRVLPEADAALIADLYKDGSMTAGYSRLLNRWMGEMGLVVVQSQDVRAFGRDIYLKELHDYDTTTRLIQEAAHRLESVGYKPGFSGKQRVAPHFFVATEPLRIRAGLEVLQDSGSIRFRERSSAFENLDYAPREYTREQLAAIIQETPQRVSAAAALRPVVQQKIFPVVAAVLGPGEIAYWSQLLQVHEHFGAVWPLVVPRATATLIDGTAQRQLAKLGLDSTSSELFGDADALRHKVLVSGDVLTKMRAHREKILGEFDALAAEINGADGGLKPLFEKARERFVHELQRIEEKTALSLGQKEGAAQERAARLSALFRPQNAPQERVLCSAQFVARVPNLPSLLLDAIDPSTREHLLILLEETLH